MTMREPAIEREPVPAYAATASTIESGTRTIEPVAEIDDGLGALNVAAETKIFDRDEAPLSLDLPRQSDLYEAPEAIETEELVATAEADTETETDEEAPLFAGRPLSEEPAQQKGGWLSLFGGRARNDPPAPLRDYRGDPAPVLQARAAAGGQALAAQPDEDEDAGEDLEIPSFLRRLAN
jgi:hypothetical protein